MPSMVVTALIENAQRYVRMVAEKGAGRSITRGLALRRRTAYRLPQEKCRRGCLRPRGRGSLCRSLATEKRACRAVLRRLLGFEMAPKGHKTRCIGTTTQANGR